MLGPGRSGDIQSWIVGTPDLTGKLRAEAYGSRRTYLLTYQGRDVAGNVAGCTLPVRVPPG